MYFNFFIATYHRKTQTYMKRVCKQFGLSFEEGIILLNVHNTVSTTQEEIAVSLVLDPSAVTRSMKSLEKKGFLERAYDVNNQRRKLAKTTPAGEAVAKNLGAYMKAWHSEIFQDLSEEDVRHIKNYGKILYQQAKKANIDAALEKATSNIE